MVRSLACCRRRPASPPIVGTGADGALPITSDVYEEAERRGVRIEAVPTRDACRLLADLDPKDVYAILHVTC
jgi:hypothetical protein